MNSMRASPQFHNQGHQEPHQENIDLRAHLHTLIESRWLVLGVASVCVALAVAYGALSTPIYRTDTLLQVEEEAGGLAGLDDASALFTGETPAETEIEILRSRSLVGIVVDELALDVEVQAKRFPIVGAAISRQWNRTEPRPAILGMKSYAWGGESIKLNRIKVPREFENAPLTLVAGKNGTFRIHGSGSEQIELEGQVGQLALSNDGRVQVLVGELIANEGARFVISLQNRDEAIARLQQQLVVREKGKKTGILHVALQGPDPLQIAATLDSLADAYLKQNVDRRSEEAHRTLEFLNTQLPVLKSNLEAAEQELNTYRSKNRTVDLSLEAESLLERAVEVEKGITQLDIERADLRQRFTDNHSKLAAMRLQIAQLKSEREAVDAKLRLLPAAELKSARYMRDVKVANELYVLLLNKAQELKVMKSGTIGNVRILDSAIIAMKPVAPNKAMTAAMGLLLGLVVGASMAVIRKAMNGGVEDPNEVERMLGLPTYATVPHSRGQAEHARAFRRGKALNIPILATLTQPDIAVESIKSLRTALQFALIDAKNSVIAIGGPSPEIGKSFIAVNLAQILADAGKKVLLVDADMRKGKLYQYFTGPRAPGLSEVLSGSVMFDSVVQNELTKSANLAFLSAGVVPPNPSELLMSDRFRLLLERAAKDYDLVVLDCPPILAVTDGAIIGQMAGVNLLVLKAARHPIREIDTAVKRYQQNGVAVKGVVFNSTNALGRGHGAYSYHYKY